MFVAYSLVFMWLWRMPKIKHTAIGVPVFLFALLAVVSAYLSVYRHDSLYALAKLFCYIGVYYLIVNEFDRQMIKRVLYSVVVIGTFLSVYGFLQNLNILGHSWWDPEHFIAATFVNHNHFSGYLELTIPVAAAFALRRRSFASVLFSTMALVIMMTAFVFSQSRGAWISLVVSFIVMLYIFWIKAARDAKRAAIIILLVAAVISLVYFNKDVIIGRLGGAGSIEQADVSFDSRLKIWSGCLNMIKDNPFTGTGIGTFIWAYPRYKPEGLNWLINFAHNDYIETACDMGIPALIVMLWIIIAVVKTGIGGRDPDLLRLGCAIGILSLSLHALSDFNFHIPANMLLFTVYAAIIMKGRE
jgi:O-antigen ligase